MGVQHGGAEDPQHELPLRGEGRADELGQVGRHRDHLGLHPEAERGAAGEPFATHLGEVQPGGDAELRAHRLDDHRHDVRHEDDPQQHVAVPRTARHVGGEVAGVDVGDRGDEVRAEEGPDAVKAAGMAVERAAGGLGDGEAVGVSLGALSGVASVASAANNVSKVSDTRMKAMGAISMTFFSR